MFQSQHGISKRQTVLSCGGPYTNSISSSVGSGVPVGTVTGTSTTGQSVWYTIPDATYNQYFNVNPYTGVVTTGANVNGFNLNSRPTVQFTVQATDAAGLVSTTIVLLNIEHQKTRTRRWQFKYSILRPVRKCRLKFSVWVVSQSIPSKEYESLRNIIQRSNCRP